MHEISELELKPFITNNAVDHWEWIMQRVLLLGIKDEGEQQPSDIQKLIIDNEPVAPYADRHLTEYIKINTFKELQLKEESFDSTQKHADSDKWPASIEDSK